MRLVTKSSDIVRSASQQANLAGLRALSILADAPNPRFRERTGDSFPQVGKQVRRVGRPQAGDRIPACRGRIAGDRGRLVVARGDIVEIFGVLRGIARDLVELRIDVTQISASYLIGNRDQPGPLRRTTAGATHTLPSHAAP